MTAPDQTNAEVSDERLRYAGDKAKAVGWTLDPDYLDKINREILEETGYDTTIEVIEAALLRGARSVTSQASEGEDLWPNGLPEPTIDMLDLARNLPGMPSWVRAFARATAKDGADAQRLEGIARALEVLSASPSKRVERLETADIERLARSAAVSAVDAIHGYTMEFAQSPANHRDEYDQAESAIRYELTRALGAPS